MAHDVIGVQFDNAILETGTEIIQETFKHPQVESNWQCEDLTDTKEHLKFSDLDDIVQCWLCNKHSNQACSSIKHNDTNLSMMNHPSAPSQVSHWLPLLCNKSTPSNLSSLPSLVPHYVRLPNPGKVFSSLEHLEVEFRELLRTRRHQNCKQM